MPRVTAKTYHSQCAVCSGLMLICILSANSTSAQSVDTVWVRLYNGPANCVDLVTALETDAEGNVYVAGPSDQSAVCFDSSIADFVVVKYNAEGEQLWARWYDGQAQGNDVPCAVAVNSFGDVYVAGTSFGGASGDDIALVKYLWKGLLLWERRYNGPAGGADRAWDMALAADGSIYVVGESFGASGSIDALVLKYNASGDLLWERRTDGSVGGTDRALRIAIDRHSNAVVTGISRGADASTDLQTLKYDPEGTLIWSHRFSSATGGYDSATAMALGPEDQIAVAGTARGQQEDYLVLVYDSSGYLQWHRQYNGDGDSTDIASGVKVGADGSVYVTGASVGLPQVFTDFDYLTIKYDSVGNVSWVRRYNGASDANRYDVARALGIDSMGGVYVAGESAPTDGTGEDCTTLKYDSDGTLLWESRLGLEFSLGAYESGSRLRVDSKGTMHVAGFWSPVSTVQPVVDFLTIKYVQCSCACLADPHCDSINDVLDVLRIVDVAFRGLTEETDPSPFCRFVTTDVDCSATTDVVDVVKMVNVAFRSANAATEFCNPCL